MSKEREQRLILDLGLNLDQAVAEGHSRWDMKIRMVVFSEGSSLAFKYNTNYWAKLAIP